MVGWMGGPWTCACTASTRDRDQKKLGELGDGRSSLGTPPLGDGSLMDGVVWDQDCPEDELANAILVGAPSSQRFSPGQGCTVVSSRSETTGRYGARRCLRRDTRVWRAPDSGTSGWLGVYIKQGHA